MDLAVAAITPPEMTAAARDLLGILTRRHIHHGSGTSECVYNTPDLRR
jgi:hypothetical protein